MTTTEIKESGPVITYEPTVDDKIQRVLYRLESGEQLARAYLKDGDNFCVLGMFADESGLGHWEHDRFWHRYVVEGRERSYVSIPRAVSEYYGFVRFNLFDLPYDLRNKIHCLVYGMGRQVSRSPIGLGAINDAALKLNYPYTNQLLADIIRSGVLFDSHSKEN